jgi:hypothetical protein
MKCLAILLAVVCACDDGQADTDEVQAAKLECHDLLKHLVLISTSGAMAASVEVEGRYAEGIVAKLPVEDIQSCVASEPEIRACMLIATDVRGVKKCIPSQPVLDCMQTAGKAKRADIRAKCWAGDPKAAAGLKID